MGYILSDKTEGCIFCELPKQNNDRENLILYRSSHTYIIMNRYPYNNGHIMVVPYLHAPSLEGLNDETMLDLMKVTRHAVSSVKKAFMPEGFNIGINLGKDRRGRDGNAYPHPYGAEMGRRYQFHDSVRRRQGDPGARSEYVRQAFCCTAFMTSAGRINCHYVLSFLIADCFIAYPGSILWTRRRPGARHSWG